VNEFEQKENDLAVLPQPPGMDRVSVVLAEEERLNMKSAIRYAYVSRGSAAWLDPPTVEQDEQNPAKVTVQGRAFIPVYPSEFLQINVNLLVPPLEAVAGMIDREDVLYLVGLVSEVGADQDPALGQLTFNVLKTDEETQEEQISQTLGENSHRMRAFVAAILAPENLTIEALKQVLSYTDVNGNEAYHLAIAQDGETGFPLGLYHLWSIDDNWVEGRVYPIIPDYIDILPVAKIRRRTSGTTGGNSGESQTEIIDQILNPDTSQEDVDFLVSDRLSRIISGFQYSYRRTVINLTLGPVSSNLNFPGETAISSNGSSAIANGQRISFTDQPWVDTLYTSIVIAENDGSDRALASVGLSQSVPPGTTFSENLDSHRIFNSEGEEASSTGRFSRLGQSGVLTWIAGEKSLIRPGEKCYICPAIAYPAGSGINLPFRKVMRAWNRGQEIKEDNIRHGGNRDIEMYEQPKMEDPFLIISGQERSAIHYIYQDIVVQSSNTGVLRVPDQARGCFAFIEGMDGRIDKPVLTVPRRNAPYRALIYHPPRLEENWQFEISHPSYQGSLPGYESFLDGATIWSNPTCVLHTQGGGNSVHQGEASLRFVPVAKHLPRNENGVAAYHLKGPVHLAGTPYPGPITYRSIDLSPAPGLTLPRIGQPLQLAIDSYHQYHLRSLRGRLLVEGNTLGYRIPVLNHDYPCQIVVSFAVRKMDEVLLLVITSNNMGGTLVEVDSSKNTAFDLFKL
jgi:hypothetical protein